MNICKETMTILSPENLNIDAIKRMTIKTPSIL